MPRPTDPKSAPSDSRDDPSARQATSLEQAVALHRAGRLAEAEHLYRAIMAAEPSNARAWVLCAQLAAQRGDAEGGIQLLQTALRIAPNSVPALNGLAALSLRLGRLEAADAACRRALMIEPNNAVTHFNQGQVADAAGRLADAVGAYGRALAVNPNLAAARLPLAVALHRLGRDDEAMAAYGRVSAGDPAQPIALFNLGMLHQSRHELAEAVAAYQRAIEIKPNHADAALQLGNVYFAMERFGDAAEAYRRVLAQNPGMAEAHNNLAKTLWALGDAAGALAACEASLRARPGDTATIAFKAVLLRETGDEAGARALVDYDRFLRSQPIDAPAGFAGLADFNAAIAQFAQAHPTLVHEPRNNATRDGKHTGDLLAGSKGPVALLEQIIDGAVVRYLQELPDDPSHPFVANRPKSWKLTAWAVVMEGQGYQVPHIHPQAWLSGVYYASIPPIVTVGSEDHAGWIEFGEPLPEFRCRAAPELRLVQPAEGLMLLFPSYFHHRTLPFRASEHRISLAFDVVRAS
jgi:tetratricopeptide (TPR) repeat protein